MAASLLPSGKTGELVTGTPLPGRWHFYPKDKILAFITSCYHEHRKRDFQGLSWPPRTCLQRGQCRLTPDPPQGLSRGGGCCDQARFLRGTPHFPPCPSPWSPAGPSAVGRWAPPRHPRVPCRPFPLISRSGSRLLSQPQAPCGRVIPGVGEPPSLTPLPSQVYSGGFWDPHRCPGVSDSRQMLSVETFT